MPENGGQFIPVLGGQFTWIFQVNGHLRYFTNGAEWNIIELPNVFPSARSFYNFLPDKSKLFFVQNIIAYKKLGIYNNDPDFSLIEIDLANKKNNILGVVNESLVKKIHERYSSSFNAESLNGTILQSGDSSYLLRFIDNTVYKLVSKDRINKFNGSSNEGITNIFEKNGIVYYYTRFDSSIHHFPISLSDFQKEPYSLYQPLRSNSPIYYSIAGILIISTGIFFVRKIMAKKPLKIENVVDKIDISRDSLDFNAIETIVIEQIIVKANKNELFTVTELNNTLGLNKKSLEIQKKVRTETINRINHKFKVKYNKETDLIERIRSEEDRRYYLYNISKENASLIGSKA